MSFRFFPYFAFLMLMVMLPSMAIVASSKEAVGAVIPAVPSWREAMKRAVRNAGALCRMLGLPEAFQQAAERAATTFPVFAPLEFIARMQPGEPADPLLRQVLPVAEELASKPGYSTDPVGDRHAAVVPGLLHKYAGRMLIVATGACAVHCRYCFRRHFPYEETPASGAAWQSALKALASDTNIEEVLLSGGDPLTLSDDRLLDLARDLAEIRHVRRLRVHTRLPIVIPQRVTGELIAWLRGTRLTPVVVVHANHPQEIDAAVQHALGRLVDSGIPVLNQSVLLRGVNDNVAALVALSRQLIDMRVMPYYLHELDRVAGAHHFATPTGCGEHLIAALRSQLPGYAVPRLVREVPGEEAKRVLA
jgi:EF-P beta-lysylation protein EpmB